MNCQKANQIDIVTELIKRGFLPDKISKHSVWFKSPFRDEKTASFKVDTQQNIWFDFGEGMGGTLVDLIVKLEQSSVKEVLSLLNNGVHFSFQQQTAVESKRENAIIQEVKSISHPNLIKYITERKLDFDLVDRYCFEIRFRRNEKDYYGIGFMNNLGGFEIRNKFYKGVIGKKAITSIFNHFKVVSIFESWSDFLSYLTFLGSVPDENFIILNSTSMIQKAIELIDDESIIQCFFDNDSAGQKATKKLVEIFGTRVVDKSSLYLNFNDFNEYLISWEMHKTH